MFDGAGAGAVGVGGGAPPAKQDDDTSDKERSSVANANASQSRGSAAAATSEHDEVSSAHQGIISPSPKVHEDLAKATELSSIDSADVKHELCMETLERKIQEKTEEASLPGITPVSSGESSGVRSRSGNDAISFLDERIERKLRIDSTGGGPRRATTDAHASQGALTFEDRIEKKTRATFGSRLELADDAPPLPENLDEGDGKKSGVKGSVEQMEDSGPEVPPQAAFQGKESIFRRDNKPVEHEDSSESIEAPPEGDDPHDIEAPQADVRARQIAPAPEPLERPSYEAPFFPVEATLVDQPEASLQVYDATLIPEQSSLPWWKRNKIRKAAIALIGVGLIVAIVVSSVVSGDTTDTEGSASPESVPFFHPPPFNCTVSDLGPMYESHCWSCVDLMDADEALIAMSRDEDSVIRFVSNIGGNMTPASEYRFNNFWPGALAISGNVVAVGDPYEDEAWIGAVHVVEKDAAGVWNETQHIVPSNINEEAEFGTSIDIDADVMAVGAPNDRDTLGSAFVYRRTEGTWVQEAKLVPNDLEQHFGSNILVRGNTLVVADNYFGADFKGAVFVYKYNSPPSSPTWSLNDTITNDDCDGNLGFSLAFSGNNGLLIGCPDESSGGVVYYYQRGEGGAFVLQQTIKSREAATKFGYEIATSRHYLAVGTYDVMDAKVFVFALHENIWKQVVRIEEPRNNQTHFGRDILFSGNHILATTWENTYLHRLDCDDRGLTRKSA